ncbi:DUF559 domain-containing protein [Haloechinothrix aidingensis]|uniref:DUF559 domain-containing protein n=1 Tax=Haloechinothrix aidingensis TaxID=2752311 RepID=UPI0031B6184A
MDDLVADALHGACTRAVALERAGRYAVRSGLRDGRLIALWPGVLVDRSRLTEPWTRSAAAVLSIGEGAVLADRTALYLHGCDAAEPAPVHVQVPYDRWPARRPGVVLHHGPTEPGDVVELSGLPVHAVDRALTDLLCGRSRRTALACCDQALATVEPARREAVKEGLRRRLLARPDRRGRRKAEQVLELATGLPESPAESSVLLVVVDGGFPPPASQYVVRSVAGCEIYRLDFAWEQARIALEYDGYAAHADRRAADAAREEDLRRRGWLVVRATAADLAEPARLLAELRAAFRHRGL